MATKIDNEFQQYDLDMKELLAGRILTEANIMCLKNLRAEYAQAKLRMKFDPNNPQAFVQEEAENAGWLNCISFILSEHDLAFTAASEEYSTDYPAQSSNDVRAIFD